MNALCLVVDFEFTFCKKGTIPAGESEIVDIGAVLLHRQHGIVAHYQCLVKPQWHPTLSTSFTNKTGISEAMMTCATSLEAALQGLEAIMPHEPPTFISWGKSDYRHLRHECQAKGLDSWLTTLPTLNYQKHAATLMHLPREQQNGIGLHAALKLLNMPVYGQAHRAFDDAMNTARILKRLGIQP
jgi:inhibitor of KinA sporulation pathway (predicted exonuclease)